MSKVIFSITLVMISLRVSTGREWLILDHLSTSRVGWEGRPHSAEGDRTISKKGKSRGVLNCRSKGERAHYSSWKGEKGAIHFATMRLLVTWINHFKECQGRMKGWPIPLVQKRMWKLKTRLNIMTQKKKQRKSLLSKVYKLIASTSAL